MADHALGWATTGVRVGSSTELAGGGTASRLLLLLLPLVTRMGLLLRPILPILIIALAALILELLRARVAVVILLKLFPCVIVRT